MIAYQEFPHTICSSGTDIIRWAAELAKLPQTEYADSINATVKAFETFDKKNRLDAHEIGLIYELSENRVELVLFEKKEDGTFLSVAKGTKDGPVTDGYYEEDELDGEEYNPNLDWILGDSLTNFMMDAGLRALGIYGENERDEEAFNELRSSASHVRRQLRRNDEAKVIFDNGYLNMLENFPIERFENCYKPLLERNDKFLQDFLSRSGYCMDGIAKVYLVGSEWEYPFVRKHIEEIAGSKARFLAPFECVGARGAAFME